MPRPRNKIQRGTGRRRGFRYSAEDETSGAVVRVRLRATRAGTLRIQVDARHVFIERPAAEFTSPLHIRLVSSVAHCWNAADPDASPLANHDGAVHKATPKETLWRKLKKHL